MFGKKKKEEEIISKSSERIRLDKMKDNDEFARDLIIDIKNGIPCVINFEGLEEEAGNKYLAFLEGAAVALEGKTVKINEFTYLFAKKEDFMDGSLREWINNIPK